MQLIAYLRDINKFIPKKEFINLMIIGDATSNFVFDHHFKLNSSKTTGHTNSKLGTINQHTKDSGDVIML